MKTEVAPVWWGRGTLAHDFRAWASYLTRGPFSGPSSLFGKLVFLSERGLMDYDLWCPEIFLPINNWQTTSQGVEEKVLRALKSCRSSQSTQ